jgi:alkaline phosphatase D
MDQPCGDGFKPACPEALAPDRTIMGAAQERWLFDGLSRNTARWSLIAQQVMMMPLDRRTREGGQPLWNLDSWAGYPAARNRLLDHLQAHRIRNVVVTTGDEHQNHAGELLDRNGEGPALAVEFVSTSITSGGDGSDLRKGSDVILAHNPHLKFINDQRGYVLCEAGRDAWRAEFKVLDRVRSPGGRLSTRATFAVEHDAPGLHRA